MCAVVCLCGGSSLDCGRGLEGWCCTRASVVGCGWWCVGGDSFDSSGVFAVDMGGVSGTIVEAMGSALTVGF